MGTGCRCCSGRRLLPQRSGPDGCPGGPASRTVQRLDQPPVRRSQQRPRLRLLPSLTSCIAWRNVGAGCLGAPTGTYRTESGCRASARTVPGSGQVRPVAGRPRSWRCLCRTGPSASRPMPSGPRLSAKGRGGTSSRLWMNPACEVGSALRRWLLRLAGPSRTGRGSGKWASACWPSRAISVRATESGPAARRTG